MNYHKNPLWQPPSLAAGVGIGLGNEVECLSALARSPLVRQPFGNSLMDLHKLAEYLRQTLRLKLEDTLADTPLDKDPRRAISTVVQALMHTAAGDDFVTAAVTHILKDPDPCYVRLLSETGSDDQRRFIATVCVLRDCYRSDVGWAYGINAQRGYLAEMDQRTRYGRLRHAFYSVTNRGERFGGVLQELRRRAPDLKIDWEVSYSEHPPLIPRQVEAHGMRSLRTLASIIADGVLRAGMTAGLHERIGGEVEGAMSHGKFFLVLTEDDYSHLPEHLHLAYLMPTEAHKAPIRLMLAAMVHYGLMTTNEYHTISTKLLTYEEYNTREHPPRYDDPLIGW